MNKLQKAQDNRDQILVKSNMKNINQSSWTLEENSRSFTALRQDTGSTGLKVLKHKRQHSDDAGKCNSFQNLKRILSNVIHKYKNINSKFNSKIKNNKTHSKSQRSLNISKWSERNLSKVRL